MDYELAKKLKEAGFPQINDKVGATWFVNKELEVICASYGYECDCPLSSWDIKEKDGLLKNLEYIYAPTLSELIEACGEPVCLDINLKERGCIAVRYGEDFPNRPEGIGAIPKEAFANLWLRLNKK